MRVWIIFNIVKVYRVYVYVYEVYLRKFFDDKLFL